MARGSELIEKLLTVVIVLVMLDALYPALAQQSPLLAAVFVLLVSLMLVTFLLGRRRR